MQATGKRIDQGVIEYDLLKEITVRNSYRNLIKPIVLPFIRRMIDHNCFVAYIISRRSIFKVNSPRVRRICCGWTKSIWSMLIIPVATPRDISVCAFTRLRGFVVSILFMSWKTTMKFRRQWLYLVKPSLSNETELVENESLQSWP